MRRDGFALRAGTPPAPAPLTYNLARNLSRGHMDHRLEANRLNWNERTPIHAASTFYDVAAFKRGANALNDVERREVGDVAGKSLLHLQCHFGLDTMSWARLGASATGLDFSDEAIALARDLNAELGLGARFVQANVYDAPAAVAERFDVVYTGKGALCWLPDLDGWAKVVARLLKPGGVLYLMDTHPFLDVFEPARQDAACSGPEDLRFCYGYFPNGEGRFFPGGEPSYAGSEALASGAYCWWHSVEEIIGAVLGAGLALEFLREFAQSFYRVVPGMVRGDDGWWRFRDHNERLPQTFSLRARAEAVADGGHDAAGTVDRAGTPCP